MSDPVNLAEARALKKNDSREWTAADLIAAVQRDLVSGEIKPSQIAVHYFEDLPDGGRRHYYYVAGLTFDMHIALLNVALQRVIKEWLH